MPGTSFSVATPVTLFKDTYGRPQGDTHTTYDVLPDGHFAFIESVQTSDPIAESPVVIAVFNWLSELRARMRAQ